MDVSRRTAYVRPHAHIGPHSLPQTDKEISILADLPGVKKEDIKVTVDGDVVRINVETKQAKEETKEEKGVKWHRQALRSACVRTAS